MRVDRVRVGACACASACACARAQPGGHFQRTTLTYDTRVQSKIHRLANLAAARATCQPAAAARRSQARRGAHPTQNAGWGHRQRTNRHDVSYLTNRQTDTVIGQTHARAAQSMWIPMAHVLAMSGRALTP
jgi:hypothetical protein